MNPADPEPAALVHRMRQQLILVQVRIMELEDARDETAGRLAEAQELLRTAQAIADAKIEEAAHLEKVRSELQARYDELRHVQHATNEALELARAEFASARMAVGNLEQQLENLGAANAALEARCAELDLRLQQAAVTAGAHTARIAALDGEVRAMKRSRSWRWTAWWRSMERAFGRGSK